MLCFEVNLFTFSFCRIVLCTFNISGRRDHFKTTFFPIYYTCDKSQQTAKGAVNA